MRAREPAGRRRSKEDEPGIHERLGAREIDEGRGGEGRMKGQTAR